jgi:hypothetical protein
MPFKIFAKMQHFVFAKIKINSAKMFAKKVNFGNNITTKVAQIRLPTFMSDGTEQPGKDK